MSDERAFRVVRSDEGSVLAGVCTGLANTLKLDVMWVRLAFLVLALAKGLGVLVYAVLWLVLPRGGQPDQPLRDVVRANVEGLVPTSMAAVERVTALIRRQDEAEMPDITERRAVGFVLVAGGAGVLLYSLGVFEWLGMTRSLGIASIAVGTSVFLAEPREE